MATGAFAAPAPPNTIDYDLNVFKLSQLPDLAGAAQKGKRQVFDEPHINVSPGFKRDSANLNRNGVILLPRAY